MRLVDIPTELTTAATDAVLALVALGCAIYVLRIARDRDIWKGAIWGWAFGLLGLAAALGAAAHGLAMDESTRDLLWQPLNLALGITVGLFAAGVVHDVWGRRASRQVLLPLIAVGGVGFYAVTLLVPGTFLVFVLYEAVATLFALVAYVWMAARRRDPGAWWMACGIALTIAAAAVQSTGSASVRLIWPFDHNGLFHLLQTVGALVLAVGLRRALVALPRAAPQGDRTMGGA